MKLDKKKIGAVLGVIALIAFWLMPVIPGLTKEAMLFLGIFFWTLIYLAVNVLPMEICMLLSLALILTTGIAPFEVAFG